MLSRIIASGGANLLAVLLVVAVGQLGSPAETQGQGRHGATDPASPTLVDQSSDSDLAVQVLLDRAGFSPGAIDGRPGRNTRAALVAFQTSRNLPPTGTPDPATMLALGASDFEPLVRYTITAEDAKGPFIEAVPTDMMEKAKLPGLYYTSIIEALAERFHTTRSLLRQLNPEARFTAGDLVLVPAVIETALLDDPQVPVGTSGSAGGQSASTIEPTRVIVSKASSSLSVETADGTVLFHAPVTVGSEHDPLPLGEWAVTGVYRNPTFHYNPMLFWDADPAHGKATIPPGPNNPVGLVWIDLTKEHYGIHGTPEPERIGYAESHGCIRLTNWDALRLADLVQKGTPAIFK
jgi:lipoprotein-anchoring transpeptidase ErfK/SrfK